MSAVLKKRLEIHNGFYVKNNREKTRNYCKLQRFRNTSLYDFVLSQFAFSYFKFQEVKYFFIIEEDKI